MGLNVKNLGRLAVGTAFKTVAKAACKLPRLDREYHIEERLSGPWPSDGPYLWLHGASLGECRMLLGLAHALKEDLPNCPKILITSQKVEVVSFLKDAAAGVAEVAMAPVDVPSALHLFASAVQPL
ncbi:MAG: hypothetical protein IKT05_04240, partial [Fibrobacter sp.]|nr:hypothetical protein [Fibrobacter sp.]